MADNELMTNEADGLVGTTDEEIVEGKSGFDAKSAVAGGVIVGAVTLGVLGVKKLVKHIKEKRAAKRAAAAEAKGQESEDLESEKKSLIEKAKGLKDKVFHKEEPEE